MAFCKDCKKMVRFPDQGMSYCLGCNREFGTNSEYKRIKSDVKLLAIGDWETNRRAFVQDPEIGK